MPQGISSARLVRQDRVIILSATAALLVIVWLYLIYHQNAIPDAPSHHLMSPQGAHFTAASLGATFAMWFTMMVAMMLPPVLPWILLYARVAREQEVRKGPWFSTATLVAGYLTLWSGYCLAAAALQLALQHKGHLAMAGLHTGPVSGGVLLLLAGAFQFSSLKTACLKHCRTPLSFFFARWRNGPVGAFGMGFKHGAYCLGCCWVLMALSFALGVMNLLWMALLTLFLCIEKIAPGGHIFSRIFGVALLGWGCWLIATAW